MHLDCWSAYLVCICPLWHTTLKWSCLLQALHVLSNARHLSMHVCCTTVLKVLYINSLFCLLGCWLSAILACLPICIWSKSFMLFISSNAFLCILCASTHWTHSSTCSLYFLCIFCTISSFMISCMIS